MRLIDESQYDLWDKFVISTKNGTIFHSAWWYRAWGLPLKLYARQGSDGEFEAGLPIHVSKTLGFRTIRRPPLTPTNGPVFKQPKKKRRNSIYSQVKKEISEAIVTCPRVGFYDFILRPGMIDVMPFLWNGFSSYLNYTYVIPHVERDFWQQNMSEMNRRNLKKAHKEADENNLSISTDQPIEELLSLLTETAESKEFSYRNNLERMPAWWEEVKERTAGRTYLIRDSQNKPCCGTIMVWDAHSAYYIAGGIREDIRRKSHLNLLLFERMIEDSHEMGLDFDFEGSKIMGVERFFRGWGGQLQVMIRLVKIPSTLPYVIWSLYCYFKKNR